MAAMWEDAATEIRAQHPAILRALEKRSIADLDEHLANALASPDPALQQTALGLMPNPDATLCRAVFESAAQQGRTDLQLAALDAVARSAAAAAEREAKALLLAALGDEQRAVRVRAVKHLRQLYGEDHSEKIGAANPRYEQQAYQRIARTLGHRVRMVTSSGPIEIALDYRHASLTSENFVELVEKGALEGLRVVDVEPGRYFEASMPTSHAKDDRKPAVQPEINSQPFLRGSLGMAALAQNSAHSRFFICLTPQPLANGRYTNFGRLVSGDDLLDAITVETRILEATVVE